MGFDTEFSNFHSLITYFFCFWSKSVMCMVTMTHQVCHCDTPAENTYSDIVGKFPWIYLTQM